MTISVPKLQGYIGAGLNILVTGPAGTGKTAMLSKAVQNLGMKMKYFSAATMDPMVDLIGIPVPNTETQTMDFYRPQDIQDCEVVFIDELNRAPVAVLNAVFELVQFRSINGTKLPKLKCAVAAINPVSDEYTTEELDVALIDRFDIYLESAPKVDYTYFKAKYGPKYAKAGITLFNEYQKDYNSEKRSRSNSLGYFSPRRLEKLMDNFKLFPTPDTITASLPSDVVISSRKTAEEFNLALGNTKPKVATPAATPVASDELDALVEAQATLAPRHLRAAANNADFLRAFDHAVNTYGMNDRRTKKLINAAVTSLSYGLGPDTLEKKWKRVIEKFTPAQLATMMDRWPRSKRERMTFLMSKW